jgi:hypothetical protein
MNNLIYIQPLILLEKQKISEKKSVYTYYRIKFDTIFVSNKTHHASHLNSAPGWVFDFYGGHVS